MKILTQEELIEIKENFEDYTESQQLLLLVRLELEILLMLKGQ